MTQKLTFSCGNRKMKELAREKNLHYNQVISFDLPAGHTCPAADECQSFSDRVTGKITDGENCKFRCYAANVEAYAPSARRAHWRNFDALAACRTSDDMANLILSQLPENVKVVRIHASGDYFTRRYFLAWVKVAQVRTDVQFFGYTKILPYVKYPKPDNFRLVYSFGGKMDSKITCEPVAYVVKNIAEAIKRKIQPACIDKPSDDFDFIMAGKTFALCLHGTQPAKRR
jgi:hypothetical protein